VLLPACTKLYIIPMHALTRLRYSCGTGGCGRGTGCGSSRNVRIGVHHTRVDQWVHDERLGVLSIGVCMQCVSTGGGAHFPFLSSSLESFFLFRPRAHSTGSANKSITINNREKQTQQICMLKKDGYTGFIGLSSMGRTLTLRGRQF
jgi:hypothetical protein